MKLTKKNSRLIITLIIIIIGLIIEGPSFFKFINSDNQSNSSIITLEKCVDGDTATFSEIGKTRFLFVDTPESTNKKEKYGIEAATFTCDSLQKAQTITYEYDGNTSDRYNRTLAWIFVDGKLLQEELAKAGYVKKFYDYKKEYKYEKLVRNSINDKYHIFEGD